MILGQVSWLDCLVFLIFLGPQLIIHVGFFPTLLCGFQALPFLRMFRFPSFEDLFSRCIRVGPSLCVHIICLHLSRTWSELCWIWDWLCVFGEYSKLFDTMQLPSLAICRPRCLILLLLRVSNPFVDMQLIIAYSHKATLLFHLRSPPFKPGKPLSICAKGLVVRRYRYQMREICFCIHTSQNRKSVLLKTCLPALPKI